MQFDSLRHLRWAFLVTHGKTTPCSLVLQNTPAHSEPPRLQPPPPYPEPRVQQGHGERAGLWRGEGQPPRPPGSSARPALPAVHPSALQPSFPRVRPGRPLRPEGAHLRLSSSRAAVSAKFPGRRTSVRGSRLGGGVREAGRAGVEEGRGGGGPRVPGPTPARLPRPGPPACSRTDTYTARTPTHRHRHQGRLRPGRLRRGGRGCGRAAEVFLECRVWPSNTAKKK